MPNSERALKELSKSGNLSSIGQLLTKIAF